ncbi:hypothetical protein P43SY_002840 [Pythium insidiosum]|uniref:Uncharacterized protein n=1 Tax=Pythium insidiosum TaxID=114742 RepID=A0AAD5QAF9_PYTIN|nr:hypothetical protein P43SY_002840 [Pythium insidiosum]
MTILSMRRVFASGVASTSLAQTAAFSSKRTFPSFVKYGAQSAFQVQPVPPTYATVPGRDYLKTKRLGSMMLSWAAASESGKSYAYSDKVFFSLSPTEVGLVLEVLDGKLGEVTINHSPNMNAKGPSTEKSRRSYLDVKSVVGPDQHPKTEFKISTTNSSDVNVEERVALNMGETRVLRELLTYSLPRLYGFQNALEGPFVIEGGDDSWGNNNGNSGRGSAASTSSAPEWPF